MAVQSESRSPLGLVGALVGLVWQSALLYGIARFVGLLALTFAEITASGESDPRVMAEGIGQALVPVVFWGAVGSHGLLVTVVTLVASRYRPRWFFWSSAVFAVIYILLFPPVGTTIGAALLVLLIVRRREFFAPRAGATTMAV